MGSALREQDQTGAPLLIYVYTDWCPYCAEFERAVLPDRSVSEYLASQVVKMRINPEAGPEALSLAQRLEVKGFPSFYLISPRRTVSRFGLKAGDESQPSQFMVRLHRAITRQVEVACRPGRRRSG